MIGIALAVNTTGRNTNKMKSKAKPGIINNHLGELPAVRFRRVDSVAGFNTCEFEIETKGATTQEAIEAFDVMIELVKRIKRER